MPIRALITCLLIILIPLSGADADITIEIRKQRGLLLVEDFQHWVGAIYQFSDHDPNIPNSRYMSNKLQEFYRFQVAGAIMERHVLNFSLFGDIELQQIENSSDTSGSSSSHNSRYQYSLTASGYDRSWHPFTIHSSRVLSTVVNPFSPAYDNDTTSNGIEVSLMKGPVPSRIRYERNTTDLSYGTINSNTTSETFSLSGNHNYHDISFSSLAGSWSRSNSTSQGVEQTSDSYYVNFGNNLSLDRDKKYTLDTSFNYNKLDTSGVPQEAAVLNEALMGHLGKALDANLLYVYQYNKTTTLANQDQVYSLNSLQGSITHRLLESLTTIIRGYGANTKIQGGEENTYTGSGTLSYRKKLPANSLLTLGLFGEHSVKDRTGDVSSLTIRDEPHRVLLPEEIITLGVPGPVQAVSVTVKGYTAPPPNPQVPPDITFVAGTDYTVDYNLGRITWGAIVPPVPTILVTYVALINPSVRYAIDTYDISGSLSLLNGEFLVNGSYFSQGYTLLSGMPQSSLYDTTVARLSFQGNAPQTIYGMTYEDYSSGPTKYQFVEGWLINTRIAPDWTMTLQARDRYTNYESVGRSGAYGQNTLSVSANYSRNLSTWSNLALSGNLIDIRRESQPATDAFYVKANLRVWFNKLTANLICQSAWRLYGGSNTRDDYVRFDITRYF